MISQTRLSLFSIMVNIVYAIVFYVSKYIYIYIYYFTILLTCGRIVVIAHTSKSVKLSLYMYYLQLADLIMMLLLLLFFIHSKHEKLLIVHYNRYMKYT